MQPATDYISRRERVLYGVLQTLALLLSAGSGVLMVTSESDLWKCVGYVGVIFFLVAAVVFNYGRRFGIRVLWSKFIRRGG
jgi:hypothetical protein